ncbi:MAG TPA: SURF1 family protein [Gammaproteobacteria bacterium]|nr:SURF1 family protein [Gammaproteobacteria bacterium]
MQIGAWQFKPRLLPSLATLLFFPLLLSLGFWQLDRAEQKHARFAESMRYQNLPPMLLNREPAERLQRPDMLWRPVRMKGELDSKHILLLDNQVHKGEAGYYVFEPFHVAGSDSLVLVNRGWIAAGENRQKLPAVSSPDGEVTLTGMVKHVPSTGIFLGDNAIEKAGINTYRLQRIHIDEVEQLLGRKLPAWIVRLQPDSDHGFTREWPQEGSGEARHLGYAFQWFALALTLLVIYIVVNCKKTG